MAEAATHTASYSAFCSSEQLCLQDLFKIALRLESLKYIQKNLELKIVITNLLWTSQSQVENTSHQKFPCADSAPFPTEPPQGGKFLQ
jgi:hypothetical protein